MAIVRYDPPDGGNKDGLNTIRNFFASPGVTLWNLATGEKRPPPFYPVEIDTQTGLVSIISPAREPKRNPAHVAAQAFPSLKFVEENKIREKLEKAFETGVAPLGLGPYSEVGRLIAALEHDAPETYPTAFDDLRATAQDVLPPEPVAEPRSQFEEFAMAGYLPPGGLAGFAQMAPASKLALTRGTGGTRKRRTRRTRGRPRKVGRPTRRRTSKRKGTGLVKGSAAAKRRMAQLRKMRK